MNKTMLFALAAITLTACGSKKCENRDNCGSAKEAVGEYVYYEGVLPAADAAGVRYSLTLDYDDDNPKEGDYVLTESYLDDNGAVIGTFLTEGDFNVKTGTPTDTKARYLVMNPDVKDGSSADTLYFLAESDSTLTLVSADLSKSVQPGLNYTITRVAALRK